MDRRRGEFAGRGCLRRAAPRAASESDFFFLESPGLISFERDAAGRVTGAHATGLGAPVQLGRR